MKLTQKVYNQLMEALRRHIRFGISLDDDLLLLTSPREAKTTVKQGFILPTMTETKNYPCWYKLTDKGKTIVENWKNQGYVILQKLCDWEIVVDKEGKLIPREIKLDNV